MTIPAPGRSQPIKRFDKAWEKACALAGVPQLLVHDLRRTAARLMSRAGIPDKIIMQVVGWKTRAMLDRYNIVSQGDRTLFKARMNAHAEAPEAECDTLSHSTNHRQIGF